MGNQQQRWIDHQYNKILNHQQRNWVDSSIQPTTLNHNKQQCLIDDQYNEQTTPNNNIVLIINTTKKDQPQPSTTLDCLSKQPTIDNLQKRSLMINATNN